MRAAARNDAAVHARTRLHLIEVSPVARAAQPDVLGPDADRVVYSGPDLPAAFECVLLANELLDALPVHQVVMREDGLHEVFVAASGDRLSTVEGPPSTGALRQYFDDLGRAK